MSKVIYKQKGYVGREIGPIMASRQIRFEVSQDGESVKSKSSSVSDVEVKVIDCVSEINEEPLFILGSVEFIENYIGQRKPNFYPEWVRNFMRRSLYTNPEYSSWQMFFVKRSDRYKSEETNIISKDKAVELNYKQYHFSDVVTFIDEWRYYVINGKVLTSWWYKGDEKTCENNPHGPNINHLPIPKGFCGTIDMGILDTGELALVECHHPYAIGWYGDHDDIENYIRFLIWGFKYLKNN